MAKHAIRAVIADENPHLAAQSRRVTLMQKGIDSIYFGECLARSGPRSGKTPTG